MRHLTGWSVDTGYAHFSRLPANISDCYYVSALNLVNIGARYQFKIGRSPATLRLQAQNVFNENVWAVGTNPGLVPQSPRTYLGYLTVDL